jgi:hypothetical protein
MGNEYCPKGQYRSAAFGVKIVARELSSLMPEVEDVMKAVAIFSQNGSATGCSTVIIAAVSTTLLLGTQCAQAQDGSAAQILKAMSDYVGSQKTIPAAFDSDIEVITPDLPKIQFASSGQVVLSRPDKLRVSRTGGYADVELIFDGKMVTIYGKHLNAFAQIPSSGSTDQVVDQLRNGYFVEAPGADLLLSNSYDELMMDVLDAKHIGRGWY